jgi:hypothetical protein
MRSSNSSSPRPVARQKTRVKVFHRGGDIVIIGRELETQKEE